jgi:hypothetical protein
MESRNVKPFRAKIRLIRGLRIIMVKLKHGSITVYGSYHEW